MNIFDKLILLTQVASTLCMTGLIWFVQLSHYPLFARVGDGQFTDYVRAHRFRTTFVVGPFMLAEAATTVLLFRLVPESISFNAAAWGAVLLLVIWCSTAALQVPQHEKLSQGFTLRAWRMLVLTNWIRTASWSARSALLLDCTLQLLE